MNKWNIFVDIASTDNVLYSELLRVSVFQENHELCYSEFDKSYYFIPNCPILCKVLYNFL